MVYDMTIEQLNKRIPVEWGRKESIHSDRHRLKNVGTGSKGPNLEEHNYFSEEILYQTNNTRMTNNMAHYGTPEAMYLARARSFKQSGDYYWALAKNGKGDHYYAKAKWCYEQAKHNEQMAENARRGKNTW